VNPCGESDLAQKRVAFVTGGMGGLGAAISGRLHDAGMIAAASRSPRNDHVVTWLMHERHAGRRFQAFEAYFADFDSCARRAPRVPNAFGTVDVLMKHSVTVNTVSLGDLAGSQVQLRITIFHGEGEPQCIGCGSS
jgi:NAD(P)-dependent dehydrogenase (short-subunit alcohol dehydrogenase family)